jgi:FO synthase
MIDPGMADSEWQLSRAAAIALCGEEDTGALMREAAALRDRGHGNAISYSRKVFIPLTRLCRDVCHYCTFATSPRKVAAAYMSLEEVVAVARAGAAAGCKEALFTLGDKPELRYRQAREELERLGQATTLAYVAEAAALVREETGLLPHLNPGILDRAAMLELRKVSVSQGLMLESTAQRLCEKGGPHYGSPDKHPAVRLETLRLAGELAVPFTTGILIGIGETRRERVESLLAIRDLHEQHGHIQEIIIQNFRPKPDTPMAQVPAPSTDELLWTIAVARLVFGPAMNIQAPPNLSPGQLDALIGAGLNDWGGVSPVTPDHVNPEAPWPHLRELAAETANSGKQVTERLAIYPDYALDGERWLDSDLRAPVRRSVDSEGFAWTGPWIAGAQLPADVQPLTRSLYQVPTAAPVDAVLNRACDGQTLSETDVVSLFRARHDDFDAVCNAADRLRASVNGDAVSYVVNRNINYTNVCYFKCGFCAFSKGRLSENLRGKPYDLDLDEIARRAREAWARGATEVCMQGGIHPDYSGQNYLDICRTVKAAVPQMHVHAFSPLEVWQGAQTLNLPVAEFLGALRDAGLATLPGTAAEVLDDEVRALICPDKLNTAEWLSVVQTAHERGLPTTATIMFGHVDSPRHWARHLLRIRALQAQTGGFTEFVPLPFVHMEAPLYLKGLARRGPTLREAVLMHAVARLVLHPQITNIQTSWVKMGAQGVKLCLAAGANDLGGTLMNETITRAAGGAHGQETTPQHFEDLIRSIGRTPLQRTTLYGRADETRVSASFAAHEMAPVVNRPVQRRERTRQPRQLVRSCVSH